MVFEFGHRGCPAEALSPVLCAPVPGRRLRRGTLLPLARFGMDCPVAKDAGRSRHSSRPARAAEAFRHYGLASQDMAKKIKLNIFNDVKEALHDAAEGTTTGFVVVGGLCMTPLGPWR